MGFGAASHWKETENLMNDQTTASAIRRDVALFPELHVSIVSYFGIFGRTHTRFK
jgi:hypothetical protein